MHALFIGHSDRRRGIYVDLTPPSDAYGPAHYYRHDAPMFVKADMCERIPFDDRQVDYASCHAVIDLMAPDDRTLFFKEVYRILKPNSWFSFSIAKLSMGYGFKNSEEAARAKATGFRRYTHRAGNALLFFKP